MLGRHGERALKIKILPYNYVSRVVGGSSLKDKLWGIGLKCLKRWSRSGLVEFSLDNFDSFAGLTVVSVGGFGPVDDLLREKIKMGGGSFITLDINEEHHPDIVADICSIEKSLQIRGIEPDIIFALEVLEHVWDFGAAVDSCFNSLKSGGTFIFSTPWVIPIHDRPYDYFRFTPQALANMVANFEYIRIFARGNYVDSIITLLLRGLFSGKSSGKLILLIGILLSLLKSKPKIYSDTNSVDSCIGYISIATK